MATETRTSDPRAARVIAFYETLTPAELPRLREVYIDDAAFKDPFNDVRSRCQIAGIYEHMFVTVDQPRFVIQDAIVEGDQCFLGWTFTFRLRRRGAETMTVRGATHLRFAPDGRIAVHRDYWDAAEEFYEKLPAIGTLMRWLKRRVNS